MATGLEDVKASLSLTAVDQKVRLAMPGVGSVAFQVTGTFVATLTFEASVNGVDFVAVPATNVVTQVGASTATTTGVYLVGAAGWRYIQARVSAYTSGTVVVFANATTALSSLSGSLQPSPPEAEILASAARTATTTSLDFTNPGYPGAWFYLNVTANPGGAETLTLALQSKDVTRASYKTITAYPVAVTAANLMQPHLIYPAAFHNSALTTAHVWGTRLPAVYRAIVTHSAAGSWTYSLDVSLVP